MIFTERFVLFVWTKRLEVMRKARLEREGKLQGLKTLSDLCINKC